MVYYRIKHINLLFHSTQFNFLLSLQAPVTVSKTMSKIDCTYVACEWKFTQDWTIAVVSSVSSSGRKAWKRIGNAVGMHHETKADSKQMVAIVTSQQPDNRYELDPFLLQPAELHYRYANVLQPVMLEKDATGIASKFCCVVVVCVVKWWCQLL